MERIKSLKVKNLLKKYREENTFLSTEKLEFVGETVIGKDVYNISKEFEHDGKTYLLGRVEERDSELSLTILFEKKDGVYHETSIRWEMLQDPCIAKIGGQIILNGTKVYADKDGKIYSWRTVFYKDIFTNPVEFLVAPLKMKDARVYEYSDGIIAFSRPQGEKGGKGTIGYAITKTLEEVSENTFEQAPLIEGIFDEESWGGVNDAIELDGGLIGVIGHIASMEEGDIRHYYGMTFVLDPKTGKTSELKIICERKDFSSGEFKRPDLVDVVFIGGLNFNKDGTATLFTGLSDAEAHKGVIKNPFIKGTK